MSAQLSLNLRIKDGSSFSNFLAGANGEVLERLRSAVVAAAQPQKNSPPMIFLWGAQGLGKSHLLQAACRLAQELGIAPLYLPLRDVMKLSPVLLESGEQAALVCLDDVEQIAGHAEWERALFSLVERQRTVGGLLIAAGAMPPTRLGLRLADLASRLTVGTVYALQPLNDAEKLAAIRLRAHNRGFEMAEDVARYILSRYPRDMPSLFDLLDRIDRVSLAHQRRVTIPFLRELEEMSNVGVDSNLQ
ncbi:MAG: DnaA regulatory inactivator Hda [Gammaproteobacteria bacterium]|nr:DnaA regulatory inactivator Hda [Gammaproteobacteria bacterium]